MLYKGRLLQPKLSPEQAELQILSYIRQSWTTEYTWYHWRLICVHLLMSLCTGTNCFVEYVVEIGDRCVCMYVRVYVLKIGDIR